mmetsp:Transcript_10399/g.12531  ORF Transcript_10399/g.12531 Transcript_10399/m.12531 type:complete len:220 (+) Transcript_10399:273-932(+)
MESEFISCDGDWKTIQQNSPSQNLWQLVENETLSSLNSYLEDLEVATLCQGSNSKTYSNCYKRVRSFSFSRESEKRIPATRKIDLCRTKHCYEPAYKISASMHSRYRPENPVAASLFLFPVHATEGSTNTHVRDSSVKVCIVQANEIGDALDNRDNWTRRSGGSRSPSEISSSSSFVDLCASPRSRTISQISTDSGSSNNSEHSLIPYHHNNAKRCKYK